MSVNKRNADGTLTTLANGTRIWIGSKAAKATAIANGTMPNNCLVCVTDDYPTDEDKVIAVHAETNQEVVANTWKKTDCVFTLPAYTMAAVRVNYPYSLSYPLASAISTASTDSIDGEDAFKITLGGDTSTGQTSGIIYNNTNHAIDYVLWIKGRNTATLNTAYVGVWYKILGQGE